MTATAVRERPIIMSAESVAATLAGTKTQTRRVILPQPPAGTEYLIVGEAGDYSRCISESTPMLNPFWRCPYGQQGGRLWVRERWWQLGRWSTTKIHDGGIVETVPRYWRALTPETPEEISITVRATVRYGDESPGDPPTRHVEWRRMSPLFMPRWASRLTLAITQVRVERLHDITGDDAVAEGCDAPLDTCHAWQHPAGHTMYTSGPRARFALHWNALNERRGYGWDTNPFVWVVSYRRVEP